MELHTTVVTIDKKKYVIIPQREFIELQKRATRKVNSQRLYSLAQGKTIAYNHIEKYAAKKNSKLL